MRILAAFALLLAFAVPSWAQQQPTPPRTESIESELLQLEQDTDKALLSEALLLRGRKAMQQKADAQPGESTALRDFIAEKKRAIISRSAEMREIRAKSTATKPRTSAPLAEAERQRLMEKMSDAQVDVQLLQAESQLYQGALTGYPGMFGVCNLLRDQEDRTTHRQQDMPRCESPIPRTSPTSSGRSSNR